MWWLRYCDYGSIPMTHFHRSLILSQQHKVNKMATVFFFFFSLFPNFNGTTVEVGECVGSFTVYFIMDVSKRGFWDGGCQWTVSSHYRNQCWLKSWRHPFQFNFTEEAQDMLKKYVTSKLKFKPFLCICQGATCSWIITSLVDSKNTRYLFGKRHNADPKPAPNAICDRSSDRSGNWWMHDDVI